MVRCRPSGSRRAVCFGFLLAAWLGFPSPEAWGGPGARGTFDVPFMARLSVGPTWRSLTPEQKRRAVEAYTRYIAAIYATRFDDYAGEKFEVLGQQQIK